MSDLPAISVRNVTKAYRIWESPAARLTAPMLETAANLLRGAEGLRKRAARSYRDFWALREVSFEVKKGEVVGIIGRNGSGKSTLLQIIAGTLQPTSGEVKVNGRVASLLELGSGFNPEFTGRENVYLNGAILGLSQREIGERFAATETFADIGAFIDQPVKTYSSGMVLRLAFAAQTMVHPEILIVDEALAVGDEAFQRKCFARMEALRAAGTTILLVTHSTTSIVEFCGRCLLLHAGRLLLDSKPKAVIQQYHRLIYSTPEKAGQIASEIGATPAAPATASPQPQTPIDAAHFDPALVSQSETTYASQGAWIEQVRIQALDGRPVNHLVKGNTYEYSYEVRFDQVCRHVRFAHSFKTVSGVELAGTTLRHARYVLPVVQPGERVRVSIRFKCLLNAGTYLGNAGVLGVSDERDTYLHRIVDAAIFRVLPDDAGIHSCYVDFEFQPRVLLLPATKPVPAPDQ